MAIFNLCGVGFNRTLEEVHFTTHRIVRFKPAHLHTATLIITKGVIPAKAGIQKNTGFRVKPGMTSYK